MNGTKWPTRRIFCSVCNAYTQHEYDSATKGYDCEPCGVGLVAVWMQKRLVKDD